MVIISDDLIKYLILMKKLNLSAKGIILGWNVLFMGQVCPDIMQLN